MRAGQFLLGYRDVQSPEVTAGASISKHPLDNGRVDSHDLRVVTQLTTVTLVGGDDRGPGRGVICRLPTVSCS